MLTKEIKSSIHTPSQKIEGSMTTEDITLKITGCFGIVYPLFQHNTSQFAGAMGVGAFLLLLSFVKGESLGGTTRKKTIDDD